MGRYKIARVIDQLGWCYHFIAREHAKYSRHEIIPVKYDEVSPKEFDLIYVHSPDISTPKIQKLCRDCKEDNIPIIGGYAGDPKYWAGFIEKMYCHIDLTVGISPQTFNFCKENYPDRAIFMPEPIDCGYFVIKKPINKWGITVGWAGGLHKQVKRSHLLDKLKYKVVKQSQWGPKMFVEDRTQEHMVDFYNSIDVLVLTSVTECQPRVVLEAMACGRAVVSTDVGNMKMLLDEKWIAPSNPEDAVVSEINARLDNLHENKQLLLETCSRNREHVCKYFDWKHVAPYWDLVFESVINRNIQSAKDISEAYLKNNGLGKFLE